MGQLPKRRIKFWKESGYVKNEPRGWPSGNQSVRRDHPQVKAVLQPHRSHCSLNRYQGVACAQSTPRNNPRNVSVDSFKSRLPIKGMDKELRRRAFARRFYHRTVGFSKRVRDADVLEAMKEETIKVQ